MKTVCGNKCSRTDDISNITSGRDVLWLQASSSFADALIRRAILLFQSNKNQ
jgi:hypothetical protein